MSLINLTPAQLRYAADLKEKIESLQQELGRLPGVPALPAVAGKRGRRKISAAGIARIRAGQKARWARVKGATDGTPGKTPGKRGPRKMSAAARAAIGAAARARWARVRAAKAAAAK
jgi:hypothetical protein